MRRRHECIKAAARRCGRPVSTQPYQIARRDWTILSQWDQRLSGLDPSDSDSKSLFDQAVSAALSLVRECRWSLQPCAELLLSIFNSEFRRLAIQEFVRQGVGRLWADKTEALAVILRYYRERQDCEALQMLADAVATEKPNFDVYERLITAPDFPLFRDCLEAPLPQHPGSDFHFPTHLRSLISRLRNCIRDGELSMSTYFYIRNYSAEKRRALEELLNCEYPNEEPELIKNALDKTLLAVSELIDRIRRIDQTLKELWEAKPKACSIPAELQSLLDSQSGSPHRSSSLAWLHHFLSPAGLPCSQAEQLVFPVRVEEFAETLDAHNYKDDRYRCFRNELLRVAFPEVLLHNAISDIGTEDTKVVWQDLHCLGFTDFVRDMGVMGDRLFAVFTRDEGEVPKGNYVVQKAMSFSSADDFKVKFSNFLASQPERVYILDISPSEVEGISVDSAKAAAEELYPDLADHAKSLCLLIRVPRTDAQVTGRWGRYWKLMSFEQLNRTFQEDSRSLELWLLQDTRELLGAAELWENEKSRNNIVRYIYERLEVSEDIRQKRVPQILESSQLMKALADRLRSVLPTSRVSDWKTAVLSNPALLSEPTLCSARLRALEVEAAVLLTPFLCATEHYNAFPSFLRGSSNIRKLWLELFSSLEGMDRLGEALDCECLYPFAAKDYEEFIVRMIAKGETKGIMEIYQTNSVTARHCRKYHVRD